MPINFPESTTAEFKREYTADKILRTVIAFANTSGGTIYVGVDDNGNITGISDADAVCLKATNLIRDSIDPDVTMFMECNPEIIEGKTIVNIRVQRGDARPYYLKEKGLRPVGVFVRQGASNAQASSIAIKKMIKAADREKFEDLPSLKQDLSFDEAVREFKAHNIALGDGAMLSMGLKTEDGVYTNLGLLLSDQCPHIIKLAAFQGKDRAVLRDRAFFSGSLLKQQYEVYQKLLVYNKTASTFSGKDRTDIRDYPDDAVRESLLNAIVHRDYSISHSTQVNIFLDRIEFISSGSLVEGLSYEWMMAGRSALRNEKLASIFMRLGFIETLGIGIPRIFDSYAAFDVSPEVRTDADTFSVTLPNINEIRLATAVTPDTARKVAPSGTENSFTEHESAILALFKTQEYIVRQDVEKTLSVSNTLAKRYLKKLIDRDIIRMVGRASNTRYLLNK